MPFTFPDAQPFPSQSRTTRSQAAAPASVSGTAATIAAAWTAFGFFPARSANT